MSLSISNLPGANAGTVMTSFFAPLFFTLFLPLTIAGYSLMPNKLKPYYLLAVSYAFFWFVSGTLVVYLAASTISMHYFGLWLGRIQSDLKSAAENAEKEERKILKKKYKRKQQRVVFFAAVIHVGVLLLLKYSGFFAVNINLFFSMLEVPFAVEIPKYMMPIGISFFTLQALSYILDVYHGVIKADGNLLRLALFLGFFPQIVEGPICRYSETAENLFNAKPITYHNFTWGIQRFLYGMMKKIVVADRLNPFIKNVFNDYSAYEGGMIAVAAVCYTVQLYMDFSGSMDAVSGIAQILGIEMPENFKRPFFSKTISEFWKRWHITLGTWFRDYIFYPVTSADKMKKITSKARKLLGNHYGPLIAGSIALFCVWFCNGLWHGSSWNYIFFGMYHFALILIGNMISPIVKAANKRLHINPEWQSYRYFQMIRTGILVVIGELFFRANGLKNGLNMFGKMINDFSLSTFNSKTLLACGVDYYDFIIVGFTLIIVFVISVLNEKGLMVREMLSKGNIIVRWAVLYTLILYIIIFGAYGVGYVPVDPLYAQF